MTGSPSLGARADQTPGLATGVTPLGGALVVLAVATFPFILCVICGLLSGCGAAPRPGTQRALAVGAGALGHGIVHAAYRCPDGAQECRDSVAIGLVVAGGLALVAGSMAWLDDAPAGAAPGTPHPLETED